MPRAKFQTLTEQMFYILLCLQEECYGLDILERIPEMTAGRVKVGSGTLYDLLEQFLDAGMIRETKREGRRRSYILTESGRNLLDRDYQRICAQAEDYRRICGDDYGTVKKGVVSKAVNKDIVKKAASVQGRVCYE